MRADLRVFCVLMLLGTAAWAQNLNCDLRGYKPVAGMAVQVRPNGLQIEWEGEHSERLQAIFTLRGTQPMVEKLAVRTAHGNWSVLARDLVPEFEVVSGRRRISDQELSQRRELKIAAPEAIERDKWNVFWDAPLEVPGDGPGTPKGGPDMPRRASEVRRAQASYQASRCEVRTNGTRLEITFPGLSLGIFSGQLVYTVYRGTNLLRQEAVAKTDDPSVAYKYSAGLRGFQTGTAPRIAWQDVTRGWREYAFGGSVNNDPVGLKARNRLAIVETAAGSIAVFPPPHKFFFAREVTTNLGFVYYRKDAGNTFAVGVRQPDREPPPENPAIYALYNAPAGSWQHMAAYFYLSAGDKQAAQQRVLAFTHGDTFKPLPGYQVEAGHFHTHFNREIKDAGTLDREPEWVPALRGLGLNMVMMSDFHLDPIHAFADNQSENDPGPARFSDQKLYYDGSRRFSDRNFLILPTEEPDVYLGGHYVMLLNRPVYYSKVRQPGQPKSEPVAPYGQVFHLGSAQEVMDLVRQFGGLIWQAHPDTKSSSGYPAAIRNSEYFASDAFLGASFQSLPVDLSEKRLCEKRCFGVMDAMNNWADGARSLLAENDTYRPGPADELYPYTPANYIRLARLPKFDEDWSPIGRALRAGDFFVTSGEILFHDWAVEGTGGRRTWNAEVEWTYPMEFAELVWGDGKTVDRQIIPATQLGPFGTYRFKVPFDVAGKKWVRFAVWDSAGNGAFTPPIHLRVNN